MDIHEVVVFNLVRSFSLDTQRSDDKKRVVTVTLSNGKTLGPVALKVPRHADSTDVDGFLEELIKLTPNPLICTTRVLNSIRVLANVIQDRAQTTAQASAMTEVQQHLVSAASSLQTARRALTGDMVKDDTAFEAGLSARKKGLSDAAQEVRLADNTMQEILRELRDTGVVNEDLFRKEARLSSLSAFCLRVASHASKTEWFL